MIDVSPLEDFRQLVARLPIRSTGGVAGSFDALSHQLKTLRNEPRGVFRRPEVVIFAGAHGVARHGVSTATADEVRSAIEAMQGGDAPLNGICAAQNLGLRVFDLALDIPCGDITVTAALTEREAAATAAFGMEALAGGADLLVLASIGLGTETAAAAAGAALGAEGVENASAPMHVRLRRREAIGKALALHREAVSADPLAALWRLGGREFAAIAGAIVAAGTQNVPVILDGEAAVAVALAIERARPGAIGHCVLAHRLAAGGLAEAAGLAPLLDLGLEGGDGRAGALAAGIAAAALRAG